MLALHAHKSTLSPHNPNGSVPLNPDTGPVSAGDRTEGCMITAPLSIEDRLRNDVERYFGCLTFPELKLVSRIVGEVLMDRLAEDADSAREEMDQFDREHPELLIFH